MKVLIPMQSQKGLPVKIVEAYKAQTTRLEVITIGVPMERTDQARIYEAKSRMMCSLFVKVITDEFVCMADSDCFHLLMTNLDDARLELEQHGNLGGVAFSCNQTQKLDPDHIDIKGFVIRTALLKTVNWTAPTDKLCLCYLLMDHVNKCGFSFRYLDEKKRIMSTQ